MIIGIDASRVNKPNKTGTEWYSWYLIEEFKKMTSPDVIAREPQGDRGNPAVAERDPHASLRFAQDDKVLRFVLYTNTKLTDKLGEMPNKNWQEKILAWPPKYLWTQIRLWWELLFKSPDVLLVPAHTIPLLPIRKKIKVIVNVHDVGFRRFPELYKPIQVWYHDLTMRRIKARADLIITISEFSKKEIMELYGVKPEKIKVVYLGFDERRFSLVHENDKTVLEKYKITQPYLLYVGRLEKKKNIAGMVLAFALAKEKFPELKLVLAGSSGNQFEEIKKIISDHKLRNEVIITGYLAEADLPSLYSQAEIFLFPTLYEGFGLPILEAMASGVPVITSNFAPHTEVGGGAAYYADPYSPQALSDAIIKVLADPQLKQSLIEKGLARAKEFSWRQTAEEIYKIIITN
jgi:glycosyltransferase involved in cell wall biosynthesis